MKIFAAIDVGSFELELGIYELTKKTGVSRIDYVRHSLPVGRETYSDGKISFETMEEICRILNQFKEIISEYRCDDYSVVASSALREAKNRKIVLDQIKVRTGFDVRPVNNSELRFESFKALAMDDDNFSRYIMSNAMAVDVGFGSTQLYLFEKGKLTATQNVTLGALRIAESASNWKVRQKEIPVLIGEMAEYELMTTRKMYRKDRPIKTLIATGYGIQYMTHGMDKKKKSYFTAEEFSAFCSRLMEMSVDDIQDKLGVTREHAEIIIPAAVIYQKALESSAAAEVWIPAATLCDGVAADYAEQTGYVKIRHDFENDVVVQAKAIADRYRCDKNHTEEVARLAVDIFNATKKYHGLGNREALILKIASLLHDCGKFVNSAKGSEFSFPIIIGTEIIGISHAERTRIAQIVGFNLREFDYEDIYTGKLTAILRLANSLDRSHRQKLAKCKIKAYNGELAISVPYDGSLILEQSAMEETADFFEEIIGIRPVLKQRREK